MKKLRLPNRRRDPLRRIVRRESGPTGPYVVLICKHSSPGSPEARFAKFYPCIHCAVLVEKAHAERTVKP